MTISRTADNEKCEFQAEELGQVQKRRVTLPRRETVQQRMRTQLRRTSILERGPDQDSPPTTKRAVEIEPSMTQGLLNLRERRLIVSE